MYYQYICECDTFDQYFEGNPEIGNGAHFPLLNCNVNINCEGPQILIYTDENSYSQETAKKQCEKAAQVLAYLFALPIYTDDNSFKKVEQIIGLNNLLLPPDKMDRLNFVEKTIFESLDEDPFFSDTLRLLVTALTSLFEGKLESAYSNFFNVIECITKNDYLLSGNSQGRRIYVKCAICSYISQNNMGTDSRIVEIDKSNIVRIRNKIAHGNPVDPNELLKPLGECEYLCMQIFSRKFFQKDYMDINLPSSRYGDRKIVYQRP